jgi:hypothetical protein
MAWTTPMTAVANSAFTAAQFNTHVRDNLLETAPAKATIAGRIMVTTGANAIAERQVTQSDIATGQTTTSSSFTDLATVGPSVTVTTGTKAFVWFGAQMSNTAANVVMQIAVNISGATTQAPDTTADLYFDGLAAGNAFRATTCHLFTNLTAGSNTFKLQYRVGAGTGTFYDRSLGVIAF